MAESLRERIRRYLRDKAPRAAPPIEAAPPVKAAPPIEAAPRPVKSIKVPDFKPPPSTPLTVVPPFIEPSSPPPDREQKTYDVPTLLRAIDALRARGVRVLGAAATGDAPAVDVVDLEGPVALVIGAEGQGMREAVARRCDGLFHIPQRGVIASLNASVAGAIALYEAARQRRKPGRV